MNNQLEMSNVSGIIQHRMTPKFQIVVWYFLGFFFSINLFSLSYSFLSLPFLEEHSLCKITGLDNSESFSRIHKNFVGNELDHSCSDHYLDATIISSSYKNFVGNALDHSCSDHDLDATNISSSCNSKENSTGPSVVTEPMVFITSMSEESDQEMDENDMIDI